MERTHDAEAIKLIATHPKIFPMLSDDQSAGPKDWQPPMSEHAIWLLASDEDGTLGWGAFFPQTSITLETHYAFLPRSWGYACSKAFQEMVRWIHLNTSFTRLVGQIPRSNRLSIKFAQRAGFRAFGVNEKSIWRRGQLEDQICFGLNLVH